MGSQRLRDFGIEIGTLPTGPANHLCDVPGVRVGHVTMTTATGYGSNVCTGVTAVLPHDGNWFREPVPAVTHVINGFGKTTGTIQVNELGYLESPIMLTNTFGVGAVMQGVLQYMMQIDSAIGDGPSMNVVVGECNDSYLNDMRGLHVRPEHAVDAIQDALAHNARTEGAIGAGTGMGCFGWKGGVGSASRQITGLSGMEHRYFTMGALVVSNFGSAKDLVINGIPVGREIVPPKVSESVPEAPIGTDGSIMIVLATDLPMSRVGLLRMAKRAVVGLARVGSYVSHGSGDVVVAFSTMRERATSPFITEDGGLMSQIFRATVEAVEESVLNSLAMAHTTIGKQGRVLKAFPMGAWVQGLVSSPH